MHFTYTNARGSTRRATIGPHHSWVHRSLLQLDAASLPQGLTTVSLPPPLSPEKPSFPLSFYAPASWSFYSACWTSYPALASAPVGNEHYFSSRLEVSQLLHSRLVLKSTQATSEYTPRDIGIYSYFCLNYLWPLHPFLVTICLR